MSLCACGCGQDAGVYRYTDTRTGVEQGQPRQFIHGHNRRPFRGIGEGPRRKVLRLAGRYTREHVARAERALGRRLRAGEVVHHHTDEQLVICQNQRYHLFLERRTRVVRAGGNPNTDALCSHCRGPKPFKAFSRLNSKVTHRHVDYVCRECRRATNQRKKLDPKREEAPRDDE